MTLLYHGYGMFPLTYCTIPIVVPTAHCLPSHVSHIAPTDSIVLYCTRTTYRICRSSFSRRQCAPPPLVIAPSPFNPEDHCHDLHKQPSSCDTSENLPFITTAIVHSIDKSFVSIYCPSVSFVLASPQRSPPHQPLSLVSYSVRIRSQLGCIP